MVSIIIPCHYVDEYTARCIYFCEMLPNKDKEIIVVDDYKCAGYPASKRNWALQRARGDVVAFIDNDAYPSMDWLNNALPYLSLDGVVAVCGAGILPADAPLLEQASDLVYRLLPFSYRVIPKKERIVKEFPTFNLIVKKKYADIGFKSYLTGEDSLFCWKLNKYGKIVYSPYVIVYHNRRPLFRPFIDQISTYGLHRGHLIRLALLGLITTFIVYSYNFIKGFFKKKL